MRLSGSLILLWPLLASLTFGQDTQSIITPTDQTPVPVTDGKILYLNSFHIRYWSLESYTCWKFPTSNDKLCREGLMMQDNGVCLMDCTCFWFGLYLFCEIAADSCDDLHGYYMMNSWMDYTCQVVYLCHICAETMVTRFVNKPVITDTGIGPLLDRKKALKPW